MKPFDATPDGDGKIVSKKYETYTSEDADHGEDLDETLNTIGTMVSFLASKIGAANFARMLERMVIVGHKSTKEHPMTVDVFVHDDCGPNKDEFAGYIYIGNRTIQEMVKLEQAVAHMNEVEGFRVVEQRKRSQAEN